MEIFIWGACGLYLERMTETVSRFSLKVEESRRKLARAQTTGKSGGVIVKISGRGTVQVELGETSLSKPERASLEKHVAEAVDEALGKQRRRVEKEIHAIT